jgi:hypothetical protein
MIVEQEAMEQFLELLEAHDIQAVADVRRCAPHPFTGYCLTLVGRRSAVTSATSERTISP